ncbi:MAG: ATP-binding protein [Bacteroidota bacterium]
MNIQRHIETACLDQLKSSRKVLLIYGPRQVGKTTLVKQLGKLSGWKVKYLSADLLDNELLLMQRDIQTFSELTEGYQLLIIDEAQRVQDIGLALKVLYDELPHLKVIATGSSSFEMANRAAEPLTGRKTVFHLLPFSLSEIIAGKNKFELDQQLEELLRFGMYPEIFMTNANQKSNFLGEICDSYLYMDVLQLTNVKYTAKIRDLLRLLAFQVGQLVSVNELSQVLSISRETVERYIDLLEKAFVIFRLPSYNRNLRKEVAKMDKIYFYDTGIRNYLIDNLKPLHLRTDSGSLWENFVIAERRKQLFYNRKMVHSYFWRTYTGAEIDYVEEGEDGLMGFEIKMTKDKVKPPKLWQEEYKGGFHLVNRKNYLDLLLEGML